MRRNILLLLAAWGVMCLSCQIETGAEVPRVGVSGNPGDIEMEAEALSPMARHSISCELRGYRFELPSSGYDVRHRHFTESASPKKFKESLVVLQDEHERVVGLDVWTNPRGMPLDSWFQEHLFFLMQNDASMERRVATAHETEVLLVHQPRSPQAFARKTAVFALHDHIFRLTCFNADDEDALTIFSGMLESLHIPEMGQ